MQVVITPPEKGVFSGKNYLAMKDDDIIASCHEQVQRLYPSARALELKWGNVVTLVQSLYREEPGMDQYRPDQATPMPNFFLAGSYTKQDYIDSMEGATLSGRQCAAFDQPDRARCCVPAATCDNVTAAMCGAGYQTAYIR